MTEPFDDAMRRGKPASDVVQRNEAQVTDRANGKEGWDEKLKTLQREKSQLEQALLDRDAELAALKQKENSLSVGCDK